MSRTYATILAVRNNRNRWEVCFADMDHVTALGKSPTDAIHKLCDFFGTDRFAMEELTPIEGHIGASHLEFALPFRSRKEVPRPSRN